MQARSRCRASGLYVVPSLRRRGIGTRLVRACGQQTRRLGNAHSLHDRNGSPVLAGLSLMVQPRRICTREQDLRR
jgi:GNAT superfamily N-acetyltransferase